MRLLEQNGVESARLDAEVLLRHVLRTEAAGFYTMQGQSLNRGDEQRFGELLSRRARREPVAYLTGQKEFWSFDFIVTPDVLVPRPETELLVEVGLEAARQHEGGLDILDVGTGSGVIAVCLAKELREARVTALDASAAALDVARRNAERHRVAAQIRLIEGDLFMPLRKTGKKFHLVVSNPPYIPSVEVAELPLEISRWEPARALDGGIDGLDFYRRIIAHASDYLVDGGLIALEIGADMADAVGRIFNSAARYGPVSVYRDYAGKDRVIAARTRPGGRLMDG
jgi:release factor glutamine methyltransferase